MKKLKLTLGILLIALWVIPAYAESPYITASTYLRLWQSGDYSTMYDMLSDQSKTYISRGEFIDQHQDFARKYIIDDFEILEVISQGQTAIVYYRLELTRIDGGIDIQDKRICLVKEKDKWKIDYWRS